jgi:hypothetical protein
MGLAYVGFGEMFILFFHVIAHGATYLIATAYNNEMRSSDWVLRPEPNLGYTKLISLSIIALAVFLGWPVFNIGFMLMNTWYTIVGVWYFSAFQKRSYKKV